MDGVRIQKYWSNEIEALLKRYKQFETLVPSRHGNGSAHNGEDGRYVEDLLGEYLTTYLPKGLAIITGFILRPAVKTGKSGKERKNEIDEVSSQLDIMVYDIENYPVFQKFGNTYVVPPEGVIAVLSVKKHLRGVDIVNECNNLYKVSKLCSVPLSVPNENMRGPYLALISMKSDFNIASDELKYVFKKMNESYQNQDDKKFDDVIGLVTALSKWSVFKRRPNKKNQTMATIIGFKHKDDEVHLGFQFILTGILSVFYDQTRRNLRRPGFTAFPSHRAHDVKLGDIIVSGLR